MRTEFLCVSVLRVASGPRVKLASCKSALNPPVVYSTDRSKAVVPVLVLLFVALWFILRGDLLYVFPCVTLFLCFSVLLVLWLPRLGKRELILVLFVHLFDLCLFGFVGFLFLLGSGKGCGLWLWHSLDFSLTFFVSWLRGCRGWSGPSLSANAAKTEFPMAFLIFFWDSKIWNFMEIVCLATLSWKRPLKTNIEIDTLWAAFIDFIYKKDWFQKIIKCIVGSGVILALACWTSSLRHDKRCFGAYCFYPKYSVTYFLTILVLKLFFTSRWSD